MDETGLVIVIDNFDHNHSAMRVAVKVLDIISGAALRRALIGNRVLCLIRSDDPWLEIGAIGGYSPEWNPRGWRNADWINDDLSAERVDPAGFCHTHRDDSFTTARNPHHPSNARCRSIRWFGADLPEAAEQSDEAMKRNQTQQETKDEQPMEIPAKEG